MQPLVNIFRRFFPLRNRFRAAPGYALIKRLPVSNNIEIADYQHEHLMKGTWGEVVSVCTGYSKKGLLSPTEEPIDVEVGDVVCFSYTENIKDDYFEDNCVLVEFSLIYLKESKNGLIGLGEWLPVEVDMTDPEMNEIKVSRADKDIWDRGVVSGKRVLMFPSMAKPIEYPNAARYGCNYFVIQKKYVYGNIN